MEDLLPFSDEALCRAVFACRTPVVRAIGHETDTPLVDFVADVRASTPTDAAKRVVPDLADELRLIAHGPVPAAAGASGSSIEREQQRLDALRSRPVLARPVSMLETAGRAGHGVAGTVGPDACPTGSTGPPPTCTTRWPGCGRCRRRRRWSAATRSSSGAPTGTS